MVSILTLVFFCFCWQNLILFTLSGFARSVCVKLDKYLKDVHRRSIAPNFNSNQTWLQIIKSFLCLISNSMLFFLKHFVEDVCISAVCVSTNLGRRRLWGVCAVVYKPCRRVSVMFCRMYIKMSNFLLVSVMITRGPGFYDKLPLNHAVGWESATEIEL